MKSPLSVGTAPWIGLASLLILTACSDDASAPSAAADAERAAYEACLEDHMTAAMAWEAIEARCRAEVAGSSTGLEFDDAES